MIISLVVTIIVMIILASAIIFVSSDTTNNAKIASFVSDLTTIEDMVEEYYLNNVGLSTNMEGVLPEGYIQLEYLESTGLQIQYIDTNVKITTTMTIKTQFKFFIGYSGIIGGFMMSDSGYPGVVLSCNTTRIGYRFGGTSWNNFANIDNEIHNAILSYRNIVFDEISYSTTETESWTDNPYSLYLFTANKLGSPHSNLQKSRIYYYKIYDNNSLIRNFIPCKNSLGILGMYDTVNDIFYTNAGEGSFIAGNIISSSNIEIPLPVDEEETIYNKSTLIALVTKGGSVLSEEISANGDDDNLFYVIDLEKLPIDSINSGKKEYGDNDIYVVSSENHNVYYVQGEKIAGQYYFSLSQRLTGNSKVDSNNTADSSTISIVNSTSSIKLSKSTNNWTNDLTINVSADLGTGETLTASVAGVSIGSVGSTINLDEVLASNSSASDAFYAEASTKTVTVQKIKDGNVVAEATISASNLDTLNGTISSVTATHTNSGNYIISNISGYTDVGGSDVKELRVVYTKKSDDSAYYDNLPETITSQYVYNSGKTASPGIIKLPSDVKEYVIVFVDNAGNISEPKIIQIA